MSSHNELGPIAQTYDELQGLPLLRRARSAYPLPPATPTAFVRTVLQAAEIVLHNLADLTGRAADDLPGSVRQAVDKLGWASGFHNILLRLSRLPTLLAGTRSAHTSSALHIADSPAFGDYMAALRRLDTAVLGMSEAGRLPIREILAGQGMGDPGYRLLHLLRMSSQHSRDWERNLGSVPADIGGATYDAVVATAPLRAAVFELSLHGDTFFTQFRGLHQVPEVLGAEASELLEQSIIRLRRREPTVALEWLRLARVLMDEIASEVQPLADNLSISDYHKIRGNLGQTSGSHSTVLRHEIFGDLYRQLVEAALELVGGGGDVEGAVRGADQDRHRSSNQWITHAVLTECQQIRAAIERWRESHLHLPRNTLGGGTRSLAGAPDAVRTVEQMRTIARRSDPLLPVFSARGAAPYVPPLGLTPLTGWLDDNASLDSRLAEAIGQLTQERFTDVQQRTGRYAALCPFTPPARRIAGSPRPPSPTVPPPLPESRP